MEKEKLIQMKQRILALGLVGVMIGTTGCSASKKNDSKKEIGEPSRVAISQDYYNIENYYKYIIKNGEAVKVYNSQNVYLLYNKETYEVREYIFSNVIYKFGGELYDLVTEEMLFYSNGLRTSYNRECYDYLVDNNYQVCLNEVGDYIEGYDNKEYYTLGEIKEIEPLVKEGLKIINKAKAKIK